eukprot:756074-Pleurochrysis_carterae.AAC.2
MRTLSSSSTPKVRPLPCRSMLCRGSDSSFQSALCPKRACARAPSSIPASGAAPPVGDDGVGAPCASLAHPARLRPKAILAAALNKPTSPATAASHTVRLNVVRPCDSLFDESEEAAFTLSS